MPFVAATVKMPEDIRLILSRVARSKTLPARQVQRARIILLAADGFDQLLDRILSASGEAVSSRNFLFSRKFLKKIQPNWQRQFPLS